MPRTKLAKSGPQYRDSRVLRWRGRFIEVTLVVASESPEFSLRLKNDTPDTFKGWEGATRGQIGSEKRHDLQNHGLDIRV